MARYVVSQNEGLAILPEMFQKDSYAFAFPLDHTELQQQVNEVLARFAQDGTLQEIDDRWFGDDEEAQVLPDLELTGENGAIRFATTGSSAPFSYVKDGEVVGYDVELAMRICAELGYKLELSSMDFGGIIPGLTSGKYDMAGACITVTEERKQSVLFSDPVSYTHLDVYKRQTASCSKGIFSPTSSSPRPGSRWTTPGRPPSGRASPKTSATCPWGCIPSSRRARAGCRAGSASG